MGMVVYDGRLYAAPVLVVVVGGLCVRRRWWGMVWIVGFYPWLYYNGELYAGAGRYVFRVYKAWVFKRRYYELDVSCGYPWRGLFVSRGFLLIGDSLYDRIGRWDDRWFYADVDVGGYDFAEFGEYVYATAYDGVLYRFRDGIRWGGFLGFYWGGDVRSLAVYKGKLFMGYSNGGRGTVLAIRVGACL